MDNLLREAQVKALKVFAKQARDFALAGGTALELYYLKHRFSADLDFFSPKYSQAEASRIISSLKLAFGENLVKKEQETRSVGKAQMQYYSIWIKKHTRQLKIDFIEDVLFPNPKINTFKGVRVYSIESIYYQKLSAVSGVKPLADDIGRQFSEGRREARDIFDIYMLSQKIKPLHIFLKNSPGWMRRGIVHWYRAFSRQDLKLAMQDLDIYDKKFDSRDMIIYLEDEIKQLIKQTVE